MVTASIGSAKSYVCKTDLPPAEVLFGSTARMEEVRLQIEAAASANLPLLIRGEPGTGKETVAKFFHLKLVVSRGHFVRIDCSAGATALTESKLLGYQNRLVDGANSGKSGRVEASRWATHFLDEVGDLNPGLQEKLLQALQDSSSLATQGQTNRATEVRLVSTTSHDIESDVKAGAFHQDLFRRLNGIHITMPPLREREEDIPGLVDYLCAKYNRIFNRHTPSLSVSAIDAMKNYNWPGNIRELENVLRRYVIFGQESLVLSDVSGHSEFLQIPDFSKRSDLPLKSITRQVKRELERKLILRALEDNQWSRKKAASTLKISYRALLYKIRGSGIPSLRNIAGQRREAAVSKNASGAVGPPEVE